MGYKAKKPIIITGTTREAKGALAENRVFKLKKVATWMGMMAAFRVSCTD
jgi:hypothetical protein